MSWYRHPDTRFARYLRINTGHPEGVTLPALRRRLGALVHELQGSST